MFFFFFVANKANAIFLNTIRTSMILKGLLSACRSKLRINNAALLWSLLGTKGSLWDYLDYRFTMLFGIVLGGELAFIALETSSCMF